MIEVLMPLHNLDTPQKQLYFTYAVNFVAHSRKKIHALCDKTIQKTEDFDPFAILTNYNCEIHENCHEGEWEKIQYGFDLCKSPHIAICHQDDFWKGGKCDLQERYIHDCPAVMTYYDFWIPPKYPDHPGCFEVERPMLHNWLGVQNCMPSMWLLNKPLIKSLEIPYTAITCVDLAITLWLGQFGKIKVIKQSLMQWNAHWENTTHTKIQSKEWQTALAQQHQYSLEMPKPFFEYLWE